MQNVEIARILNVMADTLEIKGDNPFRIRAYRRAAHNIEGLAEDVATLIEGETAEKIPGIGKDLATKIREIVTTGTLQEYEKLKAQIPPGLVQLLQIPGVGPKTVKLFYAEKGIDSVQKLEAAARAGALQGLPGIKAKAVANILRGIEMLKRASGRTPLGLALPLAQEIIVRLRQVTGVQRIHYAGSLRRMKETVGDIDILAVSTAPGKVMEAFVALPSVQEILAKGETKSSVMTRQGIQVDVRVVEPEAFGAALAYFTGSKAHNIRLREMARKKGLKISEYGVFEERTGKWKAGREEEEIYGVLGLPCIAPELREDTGEIEAALRGNLPDLITVEDIRGDLHVHSTWSDGAHTIEEVVDAARRRGYSYIAITDHSKGLGIARGLAPEDLAKQREEIERLNRRLQDFRILAGVEVDIRADGSLDLPDAVLATLDFVVASVHSAFRQARETMTQRIMRAVSNPSVRVLGHPTGRLLGEREPYEVDFDELLRAVRKNNVALEINASPFRLDLNDAHARRAKEAGISLVINTDTHALANFDNIHLGVATARRAWVEKKDVWNTLPLDALLKHLTH
ncbi:MAG: DNA polymerase/3'-5' exonuclease PolX [Candidatus Methylomirabilales bacterium]